MTQMFASLDYIRTRHSYAAIEGQPDMNPHSANSANPAAMSNGVANGDGQAADAAAAPTDETMPDPPSVFKDALKELARDLVTKEQQIEYLISLLPGLGNSEADQNDRIKVLQVELRQVDAERKLANQQREQMLDLIGDLAAQCKRVY